MIQNEYNKGTYHGDKDKRIQKISETIFFLSFFKHFKLYEIYLGCVTGVVRELQYAAYTMAKCALTKPDQMQHFIMRRQTALRKKTDSGTLYFNLWIQK